MIRWASSYYFDKKIQLWRLEVQASMRRGDGAMGRFGGGWNWKLGVQLGGRTLLVSLLVLELSFTWARKDNK